MRFDETVAEWVARRRGVGNSTDRRRRRAWMLTTFGDGKRCPCHWCQIALDRVSLTVDRFPLSGADGGTYRRCNIVPACKTCNERDAGRGGRLPEGWAPEGVAA